MLSITKLQNLKAIHNKAKQCPSPPSVVINHKTTKFESNSQHCFNAHLFRNCCYQSQNYKIWKQFTTDDRPKKRSHMLLSITKLQNLKAIHNTLKIAKVIWDVVINHKTTKFESNSQLYWYLKTKRNCCYQSQNYKIWKQFTTMDLCSLIYT